MKSQEINEIFANLDKAIKEATISLNKLAVRLKKQHEKRANHQRKPSKY